MCACKQPSPLPVFAAGLAAALFVAMPVAPVSGGGASVVTIKAAKAFAKDGGSGGNDGGSNSGSGGDRGGGGNGGRGGDDHGDGSSGRGSEGRQSDDASGDRGRGDGRGDRDGPRGRGGDDGSARAGNYRLGAKGELIEVQGSRVQVTYPGGWKEGVLDGTLELKDPKGRTVVKRRATAADRARLQALSR